MAWSQRTKKRKILLTILSKRTMPIKKFQFTPNINKESTTYSAEGAFRDCDKVRFRSGYPEKIGGWARLNSATFQGVCRSLWAWSDLMGQTLTGLGTHLKYYIESAGGYYDITPVRATSTRTNPLTAQLGSSTIIVSDIDHNAITGDFVTLSGASSVGSFTAAQLNNEFQITVLSPNTYSIEVPAPASLVTAVGGGTVTFTYQLNVGLSINAASVGWNAGGFGTGGYGIGVGAGAGKQLRIWTHSNFGEDLIFGPRGGGIYYWDATNTVDTIGVPLASLPGAGDVPLFQNQIIVTEARFTVAFGANAQGTTVPDPMLIRWSDQELPQMWTSTPINLAGDLRLANGSKIITAVQTRQEILVFTDTAVYSMQFLGAPLVFGATLVADNVSIAGPNAVIVANNVVYWMGKDKFYIYTGRSETLPCSVRQFVFENINQDQIDQVYAGLNPGFNEVWWFYPDNTAMSNNRYVTWNFVDNAWAVGSMDRTAWLYSGTRGHPIAAFGNRLLQHEIGTDDASGDMNMPIASYIETADVDLDDGDKFAFIRRLIPDLTFAGSSSISPSVTLTIRPRNNSGGRYRTEESPSVTRSESVPYEQFTEYVYIRARGRQMMFRIDSTGMGVNWQLGLLRVDIRPDGSKGG